MLHLSRLTSLALAIAIVIGAPLAQAAEKNRASHACSSRTRQTQCQRQAAAAA